MFKKITVTITTLLLLAGVVYAFININKEEKMVEKAQNKMLVAYFSFSGNTKLIAEKIQAKTGADIFRIETVEPYPKDYDETAYGIAKEQHDKGIKPELKDNGNVSDYDVIFVGTPAWWFEMAPAVKTFLSNNDFKGKTIVPFVTHGGGGGYHIAEDMEKLTGAKTLKPVIFFENGGEKADSEIENWLKELKLN